MKILSCGVIFIPQRKSSATAEGMLPELSSNTTFLLLCIVQIFLCAGETDGSLGRGVV